jgi:VWFA-related protein
MAIRKFFILAPPLFAATLNAQTPDVVLRATTRLVEINVIATQHGAAVPGLKKTDFQVYDNGKKQEIRQFSEDTRAVLPISAERLPPGTFTNQLEQRSGAPAAVTGILLDGVNTSFADQAYARQQVIQFLKQIQPQDRIAIYTLDSRGLRVLHNYTTDSADLVAKLSGYAGEPAINDVLGGFLSGFGGLEREYRVSTTIGITLPALEFIANNLATLPGRKNLIWISAGFPLQIGFLDAGRPDRSAQSISTPSSTRGIPGAAGTVRLIPAAQRSWTEEVDRTVRLLNNSNLAIYPIDARGLMASASARAAVLGINNQEIMQELARRTGGRVFINSNDIAGAIRTAVEDSSVTYTMAFYPQNDKFDNSFHVLKVKVAGLSHLDLHYRRGYVDLTAPPQDEKLRRAALADSILSPMDANGMGLRARVRRTDAGLDVMLRVDPGSIMLDPQGERWVGRIDFLFVQKDDQGHEFTGVDYTFSMQLGRSNFEKLQKEGLIYHRVIPRELKATELRLVARDASTGAIGCISIPITEIPAQQ